MPSNFPHGGYEVEKNNQIPKLHLHYTTAHSVICLSRMRSIDADILREISLTRSPNCELDFSCEIELIWKPILNFADKTLHRRFPFIETTSSWEFHLVSFHDWVYCANITLNATLQLSWIFRHSKLRFFCDARQSLYYHPLCQEKIWWQVVDGIPKHPNKSTPIDVFNKKIFDLMLVDTCRKVLCFMLCWILESYADLCPTIEWIN